MIIFNSKLNKSPSVIGFDNRCTDHHPTGS